MTTAANSLALYSMLFGQPGRTQTTYTAPSTTTQTTGKVLTDEQKNAIIKRVLEGEGGIAATAHAQRSAGMYDSPTTSLLLNDLLARASAELAAQSTPTVTTTTTSGTTGTTNVKAGGGLLEGITGSNDPLINMGILYGGNKLLESLGILSGGSTAGSAVESFSDKIVNFLGLGATPMTDAAVASVAPLASATVANGSVYSSGAGLAPAVGYTPSEEMTALMEAVPEASPIESFTPYKPVFGEETGLATAADYTFNIGSGIEGAADFIGPPTDLAGTAGDDLVALFQSTGSNPVDFSSGIQLAQTGNTVTDVGSGLAGTPSLGQAPAPSFWDSMTTPTAEGAGVAGSNIGVGEGLNYAQNVINLVSNLDNPSEINNSIGGMAGTYIGGALGGPLGATAGNAIGQAVGNTVIEPVADVVKELGNGKLLENTAGSAQAIYDAAQATLDQLAGGAPQAVGGAAEGAGEIVGGVGGAAGTLLEGIGDAVGSVICTELYQQGKVTADFYVTTHANSHFDNAYLKAGYYLWAVPYVKLMKKYALATNLAETIAVPYLRHVNGDRNFIGAVAQVIGEPICYALSVFSPSKVRELKGS